MALFTFLYHLPYKWLVSQNQPWEHLQQGNWQALQIIPWAPIHPRSQLLNIYQHPTGFGAGSCLNHPSFILRDWTKGAPGCHWLQELVAGAPWWLLQAPTIPAADKSCTLKRGRQRGGPLPVEMENQRPGAEALREPSGERGDLLPAQTDGEARPQRDCPNVPPSPSASGPPPP